MYDNDNSNGTAMEQEEYNDNDESRKTSEDALPAESRAI